MTNRRGFLRLLGIGAAAPVAIAAANALPEASDAAVPEVIDKERFPDYRVSYGDCTLTATMCWAPFLTLPK